MILSKEQLREIEQGLLADTAGRKNLCYAERDALTLLADARAMRVLVRRALEDRLKCIANVAGDDYFLLCDNCDNYVVAPGFSRAAAHPYRSVCTCAPGVSWVKDAVEAGLHKEAP